MNRSEKFWNKRAASFDKNDPHSMTTDAEKYERIRTYVASHDELLDYGCATGSFTVALAKNVKHIQALDISSEMINKAKAKVEYPGTFL